MRVAKHVTYGRPGLTSRLPLGRLMAALMLASLLCTLFAFPAQAAAGQIDFNVTSSAPKVLPSALYTYTVTLTNNSGVDADTLVFTDTLTGGGSMTAATPSVGLCSAPAANVTNCAFPALANLASATVTINATAPGIPGTATDTVSAFADTQLDTANGTLFADTIVENADLVVTKSHTGVTTPGGALTYTITVHNNGPSAATNVTLNDTAPANITFGAVTVASVPAGISTCVPAPTTTTIACAGWNIASAQTVTVTVPATLAPAAVVGSSISNTASTSTATLDSVPANNTATDAFVVGVASVDLGVTLAVAPATAAPGDTVTYTVAVTNPDVAIDATNVVVTDVLPAGLTAVSPPTAPASGTAAVASNTWTWTIPTVAKSSTVTATFDAVVDTDAALGTLTNTVNITSATQTDPTSTNNTASVDLTISPEVADLHILTAVDNSKPSQGDKIVIAIQISNAGPADATNVLVRDVLPKGLQYDSCKPCSSGLRRSTSHQFLFASIPATTASTVSLTVTVQASSGTLKNTATIVSADQSDPIVTNDKDSLNITIAGTNNSSGGGGGGTGGTSGSGGSTGGTTAFTGFTSAQLMPWFLLLFSIGLAAIELGRRKTQVSPVGFTYGFEPPF